MPTYFFDTYDGYDVISDDEGRQLADLDSVRKEAAADARELVAILVVRGEAVDGRELRVHDVASRVTRCSSCRS